MLTKNNLIYTNLLAIVIGGALSFFVFHNRIETNADKKDEPRKQEPQANSVNCAVTVKRINTGYDLIKPLLYSEKDCESDNYLALKSSIQNLIEDCKNSGDITSASVYLRVFSEGDWICANPELTYNPGSLAKVPLLLAYLHSADIDPEVLNKKVLAPKLAYGEIPVQTYKNKELIPGHSYSIKELLEYMIVYSDNSATYLLHENINIDLYTKTFRDLGIHAPDMTNVNYEISAKDYSKFLLVLYNSSYLSQSMSEYACTLLNKAEFKDGIAKPLPAGIKVAHKFGEFGNKVTGMHEFHESAIVYLTGKPYLLTVMTKGNYNHSLPDVISRISALVYDDLHKRTAENL